MEETHVETSVERPIVPWTRVPLEEDAEDAESGAVLTRTRGP